MSKPLSDLKIAVTLGLFSIPFWFLSSRFAHELDMEESHHATVANPGNLEALGHALGLAALTFLLFWVVSRWQSRKT